MSSSSLSRRSRPGKPRFGRSQRRGFLAIQAGPPQLRSNVMLAHRYRFTSSSGTATTINSSSLLFAAGCVGSTTNSAVTTFFGSVRIRRVEVWAPPASQGAFSTCSLEFNGQAAANTMEISDTSVNPSEPAHIVAVPPKNSLASFWQTPDAGTNNLFVLMAPTGSIIDVVLDLVLWDDEDSNQTRSVATAAVGKVYYLALDNGNATHIYTPVSLTTTF